MLKYQHDKKASSREIEEYTEYDNKGNQIKLIRPNNWSPFLHGPLAEDSIFHFYDNLNKKIKSSHYYWNKSLFYYYHYDISGNLAYETEFNFKNDLVDSTIYEYSVSGKLIEENTLNNKYDMKGYLTFSSYASLWDKSVLGHYETKSEYFYDEERNLVKIKRYYNNEYERMTTYKYNNLNLVAKRVYYLEDNKPFILNRYEYEFYKCVFNFSLKNVQNEVFI